MTRRVVVGVYLLAGLVLVMLVVRFVPFAGDTGEQVSRGGEIYAANCAACHGARLQGQDNWQSPNPDGTYPAPPHNDDGHTWHHPDGLLFDYVKLGGQELYKDTPGISSAMPGFGDVMTDKDIRDVIAYLKSQWSERARQYQRSATENDF